MDGSLNKRARPLKDDLYIGLKSVVGRNLDNIDLSETILKKFFILILRYKINKFLEFGFIF